MEYLKLTEWDFFYFLLEYGWFAMLYSFLLYSKVNQLYIFIYPPLFIFFYFRVFWFFFFLPHHTAFGISVPQSGIEPRPQPWKPRILTTRQPGNSLSTFFRFSSHVGHCRVLSIEFPVLYNRSSPVVCFMYSSVCVCQSGSPDLSLPLCSTIGPH